MTVTLADLNRMDLAGFEAAVGEAFELAPWVAAAAHARRPFATVTDLHAAMARVADEGMPAIDGRICTGVFETQPRASHRLRAPQAVE